LAEARPAIPAYLLRGAVIAIRSEDCRNILVQA